MRCGRWQRKRTRGCSDMAPAASWGRAAVFLDRDGVVDEAILRDGRPFPPGAVDEVVIPTGVREACQLLSDAGLLLVLVTNQPDIARMTTSRQVVDAINGYLTHELNLDAVYVCPHDDGDACACRKPAPGLLVDAAADLGLDLTRSVMVGDRWRDIEAGKRAGVTTIWLRRAYREPAPDAPDHVVDYLGDVVPLVVTSATAGEGSRR
jgi:D-glycero-D-manno-heptose 1,7-bisphosphate phosphatase